MASPFIADQIQTNRLISSGTLQISGSLTKLENGTSYLVAADNITISSASSGQITLSVSTGSQVATTAVTGTFTVNDTINTLFIHHRSDRAAALSASQGAIYIAPGGDSGIVAVSSSNAAAATFVVQSELNNVSIIDLREVGNSRFQFKADNAREQFLAALHSDVMRKFIIVDSTNVNRDFDHAAAEHPMLVLHSVTNPDTDNTQWVSFACNTTDGVIDTGANRNVRLSGSGFFGYATQKTGSYAINATSFDNGGGGFAAVIPINISGTSAPYIKMSFGGRTQAAASVRIPAGATIINARAGVSVTGEGDLSLMRVNVTGSAWSTAAVIGSVRSTTSGAQDLRIDNLNYNTSPDGGEQYYVAISVVGSDEQVFGAQVQYVYKDIIS